MKMDYYKTLSTASAETLVRAPFWPRNRSTGAGMNPAQRHSGEGPGGTEPIGESLATPPPWMGRKSLYEHTPDELSGMDVVDPDGKVVAKIKTVVLDRNRIDVHVVVSSGGFFGVGSHEIVVLLWKFKLIRAETLQLDCTRKSIEETPQFDPDCYGIFEPHRRILDFSAFQPVKGAERLNS